MLLLPLSIEFWSLLSSFSLSIVTVDSKLNFHALKITRCFVNYFSTQKNLYISRWLDEYLQQNIGKTRAFKIIHRESEEKHLWWIFSFSANLFQNDMLDAIFVTLSLLLLLLTTFLVTLSFCFFFELLSLKSFGRNKSMDGIRYENEFQLTWRRLKKSNDFSTKKMSNMSNHNLHKLSSDFQFKNDFTL